MIQPPSPTNKKPPMASENISCLPSDILEVALRKLEVKCLVRCTSVCKSWHHIIKSSSFAKSHLTCQKTSSDGKKYILHQGSYQSCTLLTDVKPFVDGTKQMRLSFSPELFEKATNIGDGCQLRIHGISDGLLCVSNDATYIDDGVDGYCVGDDLYLWNPICRKVKKLPELKITQEDDGLVRKGGVSFGFYDNDYKVIVISCVDRGYIVSVYSLTSKCWNVIRTNSYYEHKIEGILNVFCVMQPTKFVDGIAYMIIDIFRRKPISNVTRNAIPPLTVCFDLRDETIQQFKCPDEFILGHHTEYTMEAYGETIAVMVCDSYPGNLAMWILFRDKCSSKSSWEKKLVMELKETRDYPIHIHPGLARDDPIPVGFLCNKKYMVMTSFRYENGWQRTFYLYDLESQEVTEYSSPEDYPDPLCRIDSDCVESLLLLNEESIDPFVEMDMESSCSSMLFTLNYALNENGRKRKRSLDMEGNEEGERKEAGRQSE